MFYKLLSDYFLSKRGEYKESNKLLDQMAEIFESKSVTERKGTSTDHLIRAKIENEVGKQKDAVLAPETFRDMISLDVLTQRAVQDSKNGLSKELRALSIKETEHPLYHTT